MTERNYTYWKNPVEADSAPADVWAGYDEAKAPVIVTAGTYTAVLTGWKVDRNANGTPCLKFTYRIEGGEFSGQCVVGQQWLTADAMGYTKQFCDSIGIDPRQDVSNYPEIWVELVTGSQDGKDGRKYTSVVSVRRIAPNPAPVSPAPVAPAPASPAPAGNGVPGSF